MGDAKRHSLRGEAAPTEGEPSEERGVAAVETEAAGVQLYEQLEAEASYRDGGDQEVQEADQKADEADKADPGGVINGVPAPKVGEYTVTAGSLERRMGASLLNLHESSLAAIESVEFGDRVAVAAETASLKTDRSLWWMLAGMGFAILLLEWWWFQRRPF